MKPGNAMQDILSRQYYSHIIARIKKGGNVYSKNGITFYLTDSFGFCYGVDRAVDLAYATREKYPNTRLFLTTEIIHNPRVNKNLLEMGYQFLTGPYKGHVTVDELTAEDVVVIPAFGTDLQTLKRVLDKGCQIVDTTCGSVLNIWRRVESYIKDHFTVVIHGKHYHEETQATSSRVLKNPHGKYIVVLNMKEADHVAHYICQGGDKETFLKKFEKATSPGFDPDHDLEKIGLANQTTMLGSESLSIADHLKKAMLKRYGNKTLSEHFLNFDTICSATDDRQNAVMALEGKKLNLMIVVGGYNSSNTNQLCYISSQFASTYHIENFEDILSSEAIRHKPHGQWETVVTNDWLPKGPVNIGVTAGASTPDKVVGDVVEKILSFR
ncbi:MAG: 4-hydroxy-3-methylbut-2-enyl diphosphate reductase [Deltaproteobacteria bacterium RIFCSPLOWO2_02_FULL_50_16]|nr:MAG: 4-hydroxy-3-methylbut-2-enyl diphosphate reductase [Deltaproteobacteria bacterium RIFCSPHIGHO2_02_FULL_50_15]OGQ58322.1 MAG: 4-hydroxy-3-methylbut-2-enyl diphosphate reductase [Deltaproteobacteria bacterium RIFCSPLOWO2_02_FULL_50_16]OGQ66649.1 MAG: 4-hydroxy-3-methylbut-2-enyl diphosphate reductase [Deltaproteobacteria bacterium RIFCSPLOWO2_12_FULL_50_11]